MERVLTSFRLQLCRAANLSLKHCAGVSKIAKQPGKTLVNGMPSVAERLRQAREHQKLSVSQVADRTKIKSDQVRALEEGMYDNFAAVIYIRGFVRTYATMLHLDVEEVLKQLELELAQSKRFGVPTELPERRRTMLDVISLVVARIHWRTIVPLAVVALAIVLVAWGYRAWRRSRSVDPLSHLGPGLYQHRPTNSGEFLPLPVPAGPPKK